MGIVPQLCFNSLITASIYALLGVGLALTYNLLRVLNFAHGHIVMLGAYLFYFFIYELGCSFILSLLLVMLAAGAVVLLFDQFFIKPFLSHGPLVVFVATLVLGIVLESVVSLTFGVEVKSLGHELGISSLRFGTVYFTSVQIVILSVTSVALLLIFILQGNTPLGRGLVAIANNSNAAESLGLDRQAYLRIVLFTSTVLAFIAGIMIGYETSFSPTMGPSYTVKAFAVLVIGGLGSVGGTILASILLGVVENFSIAIEIFGYSLPSGYRDTFSYSAILLLLLVRPIGFGKMVARKI